MAAMAIMETTAEEMATISVIVPAAGCGARANLNENKVLAPLCGKPLLWWTLHALTRSHSWPQGTTLREVIISARRDEFPLIENVTDMLSNAASEPSQSDGAWGEHLHVEMRCVEGGETRQDSVAAAAHKAGGDYVLVHDAARPLLSPQVVQRVVIAAVKYGAAIAAVPVSDTVKRAASRAGERSAAGDNPIIAQTLPRGDIWLAQTPQVFRREILLQALEEAQRTGFSGTDCASLVERLRDRFQNILYPVRLVAGEERNFKVTYAPDLDRAAAVLRDDVGLCADDIASKE
jgi:2-C-methyl-D-erythritol 4-phosphate cytidylyltransferase